jgi:hypothetical protein
MDKLLTLAEAAAALRKSSYWLRVWLRKNPGHHVKIGRKVLLSETHIRRIIELHQEATDPVARRTRTTSYSSRVNRTVAADQEEGYIWMAQKTDNPDWLRHGPQTKRVRELRAYMEANPTPRRVRSLRAKRAYKERMERLNREREKSGQ